MNVTCPNCSTIYRVDPAKVPESGVRARCSACSAVFAVRHDAAPAPPPAPKPAPAPAARHEQPRPAVVSSMAPPAAPRPAPAASPAPAARPAAPPRPFAPAPAPGASPVAAPPRPAAPARAVNPFLSQDPALKARRLARALISDMVVYHPGKRQDGLRDGTLKELFGEEIKKSWEEYTDQVGREIADSTPYFREALNEILAGGRQIF